MRSGPYPYLAAVLLALSTWVGGTAVAAGAWDPVREATLTPVTEKRADADGQSVAVYTDIVQEDRGVRCRGRDTKGKAVDIDPAKIEIEVDDDGAPWQLIAMLPKGRDGLKVRCAPKDRRVDNATYAFAVVDGFTSRGNLALYINTGGLLAAIALTIYTVRYRRRLPDEDDQ